MTLDLQRPAPGPRDTPLQPVLGSRLERLLLAAVRGLILGLLLLSLLTALGGAGWAGWAYLQSRPEPAKPAAPVSSQAFKTMILANKTPLFESGQADGEAPPPPPDITPPWTDAQIDAIVGHLDTLLARLGLNLSINRARFLPNLERFAEWLDPSLRSRYVQDLEALTRQLAADEAFHEQARNTLDEDARRRMVDVLLLHAAERLRKMAAREVDEAQRQALEQAEMREMSILSLGLVAGAAFLGVSLGLGLLLVRCERALGALTDLERSRISWNQPQRCDR